jgi:hypothetical protein
MTSATASTSSNCTSRTVARIEVVRSVNTETCTEEGKVPCNCGNSRLNPIDDFDDIRPRLALDVDDHGRRLIHPCRLLGILDIVDHLGDLG